MLTTDPRLTSLIQRIQSRDDMALAELYDVTHARLAACVRRIVRDPHDAEEVVQDVYRQVWFNASGYRVERGAPMAWLHIIARTRALDSTRAARRDMVTLEGRVFLSAEVGPEEHFSQAWWRARVRIAMRRLSPLQREAIEMAYFEGWTHTEIALRTGWPLGTVKARIRAALLSLRAGLRDDLRYDAESAREDEAPRTAA